MSDYHTALVWQLSPHHRGQTITPLQRGILAKFAAWYNPAESGATMYPSQTYFAWLFEVSRQTVNRAIGVLVDIGYLERTRVGKGANNRYRLLEDALEEDRREKWGDVTNHDIQMSHITTSRSDDLRHPIVDEALRRSFKTKEEGGAALATVANTKIATVKRNELWDVLTVTHGEPVTKSEKSHRGKIANDMFLAGVTVDEYPVLVKAYVSKWKGNQPGPASVANRLGEYRQFVEHGPITAPDTDELVQERIMAQHLEGTE